MTERLAQQLGELMAAGVPTVLVTVAEAKGSTPREAGAAMLVTAERSFGTIGGGRLEWEGIAHARELLASGGRETRVELPLGPAVGQCCGGHVGLHLRLAAAAELAELEAAEAAADAARPSVLLFGAGHVGRALAAALAPLPIRLRWIDARADEFPAAPPAGVEVVVTDRPLAEIEQAPAGQRRLRPHPQPQPRLHALQRRPRARRLRLSRADRLAHQARQVRAGIPRAGHPGRAHRRHGLPDRRRRLARQAPGGDRGPGRRGSPAGAGRHTNPSDGERRA